MATTEDGVAQTLSSADLKRFRGLNGFHLFQRETAAVKEGRIFLVAKNDDKLRREVTWARVIRVGLPGRLLKSKRGAMETNVLAEGDRVLLTRYAGYDVEEYETGKRFVIAAEQDALVRDWRVGEIDPETGKVLVHDDRAVA